MKSSFWKSGHTPTLFAAFLYFDLSFMVWYLLGPLAVQIAADLHLTWAHRRGAAPGTTTLLLDTLRQTALPAGDFHAWVACESSAAKALRAQAEGATTTAIADRMARERLGR